MATKTKSFRKGPSWSNGREIVQPKTRGGPTKYVVTEKHVPKTARTGGAKNANPNKGGY